MINEKVMEDLIASNPEFYLGEPGLRLVGRQFVVAGYRFPESVKKNAASQLSPQSR